MRSAAAEGQLEPFTAPESDQSGPEAVQRATVPTDAEDAPRGVPARQSGGSNDLRLVQQVLGAADGVGYLMEDVAVLGGPAPIWRNHDDTDTLSGLPLAARCDETEAAMVRQLLERGWLHQRRATEARIGVLPERSSGRRRVPLRGHAVVATAASLRTLQRWNALAAVPHQPARQDP